MRLGCDKIQWAIVVGHRSDDLGARGQQLDMTGPKLDVARLAFTAKPANERPRFQNMLELLLYFSLIPSS
jgi:hypothetical protein